MSGTLQASNADWLQEFPPARSLRLHQEASHIFEQAYYIRLATEDPSPPPITFSTVALALLTGQDETSLWFARMARDYGPNADAISEDKKTPLNAVPTADPHRTGKPDPLRLSKERLINDFGFAEKAA